jgi:hypothetical protein
MLMAQYSETDCQYAFVLVICPPFQRQNWGHNPFEGLLVHCKKVEKTIMIDL